MTEKKKQKVKAENGVTAKKLRLHKETLKDLNAKEEASPKGGARHVCTWEWSSGTLC